MRVFGVHEIDLHAVRDVDSGGTGSRSTTTLEDVGLQLEKATVHGEDFVVGGQSKDFERVRDGAEVFDRGDPWA